MDNSIDFSFHPSAGEMLFTAPTSLSNENYTFSGNLASSKSIDSYLTRTLFSLTFGGCILYFSPVLRFLQSDKKQGGLPSYE